jgi:hypothetical protein
VKLPKYVPGDSPAGFTVSVKEVGVGPSKPLDGLRISHDPIVVAVKGADAFDVN